MNEVVNNEGARRFEMVVDGRTGFLQYASTDGGIRLLHTEVPPELGGRGIGAQLAKAALEHAKDAGLKVTVVCPFVKKYVEKNPQYADLM